MNTVFDAIASPTRRTLLDALARGEHSVSALVARAGVSQPAVSQQLAILREAGLVDERKDGRYRYYTLRAEPLSEVAEWVDRYRRFWTERLELLGRVLDDMPDVPRRKKRSRK